MSNIKQIANNPRARHDYHILEDYETGICLTGTEVKSIRRGKINIKEAYVTVKQGELFIIGANIAPYSEGNRFNVDPLRTRKLLMHKYQIRNLHQKVKLQGLTLVPLSVYLSQGRVKLKIGLAKGKKNYDKRQDMIKRDAEKAMREHTRGGRH